MRRGRLGVAHTRRWLVAASLVSLGMASTACGGRVVRLTERGAYEDAIETAEGLRVAPKGKVARAYAEALVAQGRHEKARAVLLDDYRHGGDLRSLVAAADLERVLGLDGMAASHFGRVADLSREALAGRDDICALLRRRAGVWAAQGSGEAAMRDLDRAARVCGAPTEPAPAAQLRTLEKMVAAAAQAEIDARVARSSCADDCPPVDAEAIDRAAEQALATARAQGPAALRAAAAGQGASLPPADIVAILSADLTGDAGPTLITDDEVRTMVGTQRWSALAPTTMSQTPEIAAYLQLRLAAVMPDVPVKLRSRTGPGELDLWLAQSLEVNERHAWRMLVWAGDLTGAELSLGATWRPRRPTPAARTDDEPGGESGSAEVTTPAVVEPPIIDGIEPPSHWTARVEPTSANVAALLREGRLRVLAGHRHHGLEIHRYVAARALAAGLPETDERVATEAAWHLAHGRPWHALAIADVVPRPRSQRVAAAAATALRLTAAFCDGPCNDDLDRSRVERTVGEAWVQQQLSTLVARSRSRANPAAAVDACPTLGELLATDATGPLAEGLRGALHNPDDPAQPGRFGHAIEADLALSCAGRYALPLMRQAGHVPTADTLAQALSHDATLDAHGALLTHAITAMVAEHPRQASLLATAAAARSPDPAATWKMIARHAHASGLRELTQLSLREALMHTPGLADPTLRRAMVVAALAGLEDGWNLRETEAGKAEPAAHVRDWVERRPSAQQWAARESLARIIAQQPWMNADVRTRLDAALWPTPQIADAHPIARGWLALSAGSAPDLEPADIGPLDLAAQELLVAMHKTPAIAPAAVGFVPPPQLEALRLAVARHSDDWVLRWRTAIGLATYGTPAARSRATAIVLEMAPPQTRDAIIEILIDGPTALEPGADGLVDVAVLAAPEDQLSVIFGLPPDPLGL